MNGIFQWFNLIQDSINNFEEVKDSILNSFIYKHSFQQEEDSNTPFVLMVIVSVSVLLIVPIYLYLMQKIYWDRKKFPPFLRFRKRNDLEAIINISVNFLRNGNAWNSENIRKINTYCNKKYPGEGSMQDSIKTALNNPVSNESCLFWLKKHYTTPEKTQLTEFIFLLTTSDGLINKNEEVHFIKLLEIFEIPNTEYIDKIHQIKLKYAEESRRNTSNNQQNVKNSVNLSLKNALKLFEFDEKPSEDELKKKYRSLVKQYHPDMFGSNSKTSSKQEAEEMFRKVQEAYEIIQEKIEKLD